MTTFNIGGTRFCLRFPYLSFFSFLRDQHCKRRVGINRRGRRAFEVRELEGALSEVIRAI